MTTERTQQIFSRLTLVAGEMWDAWLGSLPEDERREYVNEIEHEGALPGVRLIAGDDKHLPRLELLLRRRNGDVDAVGEFALARA